MSLDGQVLVIAFVAIALKLLIWARDENVVVANDELYRKNAFQRKGWLEYPGLSSERVQGLAVHPDDLKRVTERWRGSQTTGEPLDSESAAAPWIGRSLSLVPDTRRACAGQAREDYERV